MNRRNFIAMLVALMGVVFFSQAVFAQDPALAERMRARLPKVDALLSAGLAGENNEGYLAARGSLNEEQQKTLNEENADRSAAYRAIAAKTGQPVAVIGKQRAEQIRARAVSGVWLQDAEGKWYKK